MRFVAGCALWWRGTGALCGAGTFWEAADTDMRMVRAKASPRERLMTISRLVEHYLTTGLTYGIAENECQLLGKKEER
jgi:hypothetical protein